MVMFKAGEKLRKQKPLGEWTWTEEKISLRTLKDSYLGRVQVPRWRVGNSEEHLT